MQKIRTSFTKIAVYIILFMAVQPSFIAESFVYDESKSLLGLTHEEQEYISKRPAVKAVSVEGSAPIQFRNNKGEIKGISVEVMNIISIMTGLVFECDLYDNLDHIPLDKYDVAYGIPPNYVNYIDENMVLSKPFLKSKTILFLNSSIQPNELNNKIYAGVVGGTLPLGVKEENTKYYNTREESLNAVESGIADYGYGNEYSVAYYTIKNDYNNIVTVPVGKEDREYCFGFLENDDLLVSIVNKALDSINDNQMNNIILNVTTHIDRKISWNMIMEAYGVRIFSIIALVIAVLIISVIINIRTNRILKLQNRRYESLAEISNEYFFEYCFLQEKLILSDKTIHMFDNEADIDKLSEKLTEAFSNEKNIVSADIEFTLSTGEKKVFRTATTYIFGKNNSHNCVIGKLTDISEEFSEKEELLTMSMTDGLTGLYNASAARELIEKKLCDVDNKKNALVLMDIDNFKNINDYCGHLAGDYVLKFIAMILKDTFRKTDIIGRLGGDELCVYLSDIPSKDFVYDKCKNLNDLLSNIDMEMPVSLSIGISMTSKDDTYEELFKRADEAMYESKRSGKGKTVIWDSGDVSNCPTM